MISCTIHLNQMPYFLPFLHASGIVFNRSFLDLNGVTADHELQFLTISVTTVNVPLGHHDRIDQAWQRLFPPCEARENMMRGRPGFTKVPVFPCLICNSVSNHAAVHNSVAAFRCDTVATVFYLCERPSISNFPLLAYLLFIKKLSQTSSDRPMLLVVP